MRHGRPSGPCIAHCLRTVRPFCSLAQQQNDNSSYHPKQPCTHKQLIALVQLFLELVYLLHLLHLLLL